jgi:hypothetical protein
MYGWTWSYALLTVLEAVAPWVLAVTASLLAAVELSRAVISRSSLRAPPLP